MAREVILYRPEFAAQVGDLLTQFWPDPAMNQAYFSWLHEANPYGDCPHVYLLVERGAVLGMRGFHAARWEIAGTGETFDAPCACMFVVSEAARGQGLSNVIMDAALDDLADAGFRHVLSFSATPIPFISQLRRGWRLVGNYRTIRRETPGLLGSLDKATSEFPHLQRVIRYARRRLRPSAQQLFASIDAHLAAGGESAGSCAGQARAAAMSALAARTAQRGRIRHLRDPAYFDWRFKNPQMAYRTLTLGDDAMTGFLVLQAKLRSPETVSIVDWEAVDDETLSQLVRMAIDIGRFPSLSIWSAPLPERVLRDLIRLGFSPIDETRGTRGYLPGLQVRSLEGGSNDADWRIGTIRLDNLAQWDLRTAYSDRH